MIYLSKLLLNLKSKHTKLTLENPYEMHRTVTRGISFDKEEYREARCMFRLEQLPEESFILVQTRSEPVWRRVEKAFPDFLLAPAQILALTHERLLFPPRQHLYFRLRAFPFVHADGKRRAELDNGKRYLWLKRYSHSNGFCPWQAQVIEDVSYNFTTTSKAEVTIKGCTFTGRLKIYNPILFRTFLELGIGPAKGFGFGLMSLSRKKYPKTWEDFLSPYQPMDVGETDEVSS